jgi:hypothetical protein
MLRMDSLQRWPRHIATLKGEITHARKRGDAKTADWLSIDLKSQQMWYEHTLSESSAVPSVILDNADVLLADANPAVREYALTNYVPLVSNERS